MKSQEISRKIGQARAVNQSAHGSSQPIMIHAPNSHLQELIMIHNPKVKDILSLAIKPLTDIVLCKGFAKSKLGLLNSH